MKILVTPKELIEKGRWMKFCDMRSINPHALVEGQILEKDEFILTEEEAEQLGLIIVVTIEE